MAKLVSDNGMPGVAGPARRRRSSPSSPGPSTALLVTRIKLPPFIVTLGTLSIFTAITLIYAQGQTISSRAGHVPHVDRRDHSRRQRSDITIGVLLMLLLYVVVAYALRQTAWGRHLYAPATTPRPRASPASATNRVSCPRTSSPESSSAIAAWILVGRIGGGDPERGLNANLETITAVVIGGTSLFGGRGAVIGSPDRRPHRPGLRQRPRAGRRRPATTRCSPSASWSSSRSPPTSGSGA